MSSLRRLVTPMLPVFLGLCVAVDRSHAAAFTGRVVDTQAQRVFEGAQVRVANHPTVQTDAGGFFRLEGLNAGPVWVQVTLPDGIRFNARLVLSAQRAWFFELDRARHTAPDEDEDY